VIKPPGREAIIAPVRYYQSHIAARQAGHFHHQHPRVEKGQAIEIPYQIESAIWKWKRHSLRIDKIPPAFLGSPRLPSPSERRFAVQSDCHVTSIFCQRDAVNSRDTGYAVTWTFQHGVNVIATGDVTKPAIDSEPFEGRAQTLVYHLHHAKLSTIKTLRIFEISYD
jgi:hypothetical protein